MFRETTAQDRIIEPAASWWRRPRILAIVALAIALLTWAAQWALQASGVGKSVALSRVTLATVHRGTFVRDIAAEGKVVAAIRPTLYAPVAGTVTLKVHAGDKVSRGQLLAAENSPELMARLLQEESTLQSLQADLERARLQARRTSMLAQDAFDHAQVDHATAERELQRSRRAYELGSYPELQVLRAEDALEKARFDLMQAKQTLDATPAQNAFELRSKAAEFARQKAIVAELQRQRDALDIVSPVDGMVGQVQISDRATVAADAPLLTVIDLSALEVEISVPEGSARDLTVGVPARLGGGGKQWQGTVKSVSPEVVNGQVIARVRFDGETPATLRQNQRLSVSILLERRDNVLQVDRGPFVDQDGGNHAYVVHGDVAEKRPIRIGAVSINKVEVLAGLVEGDQIVVSGTEQFAAATRVALRH